MYHISSEGGTSEDWSPDPHLKFSTGIHFLGKMVKNLAEDLHIRPVLECRNPVQLCRVIVCPTKRKGKQRPKFLVRIPL